MKQEQILGIIRHVLTFVGGIAIAKGVIDEAMFTQISGAIVTLIGSIWSVISKNA